MKPNSNCSLTPLQQKVSEIVQHEYIDPNFKYNDEDFEVLSTIRYDPNFSRLSTSVADKHGHSLQKNDQMTLLDPPECFKLNSDENVFMDFLMNNGVSSDGEPLESIEGMLDELYNATNSHATHYDTNDPAQLRMIFYSRFLLLGEHFKRLNLSLEYFGWNFHVPFDLLLEKLVNALPTPEHFTGDFVHRMRVLSDDSNCYKMRVLVSSTGRMKIEAHLLPKLPPSHSSSTDYFVNNILGGFLPRQDVIWDVFIDSVPMTVSPFTTFKTTKRDHYSAARMRMAEKSKNLENPTPSSEILVYNNAFELMEGSITNVAVVKKRLDSDLYYYQTPYLSSGCLCGVMRYYLLRKHLITEGHIDVRELKEGDEVLLCNGVMGCVKGIIRNSL